MDSMASEELVITVYRITGRQLFFKVAASVCEECDLTVAAANKAADELRTDGIRVSVDVRPWLNNIVQALWRGAYHPPAVLVNGKLVSQGFVPTVEGLKVAVREAIAERNLSKTKRDASKNKPGSSVGESTSVERVSPFGGRIGLISS